MRYNIFYDIMTKLWVIYMSLKNNDEFFKINQDILNNEKFRKLDCELHHGITRFGHSQRVAKCTFRICKKLHLDYEKATRAALLHDFYLDEDFTIEKQRQILSAHPNVALINAKHYFEINDMQANIIKAHMFPLNGVLPKYKESWVVTFVDKGVALYEMYRFKASLAINVLMIFVFNMITLNR